MRRGFKKEADELGEEVRQELGVSALTPLDPWRLAEHLAIPVWRLSDYQAEISGAAAILSGAEQHAFSAMIAFAGSRRVIIHNDTHALTRQRADMSHELAHALLIHKPHVVVSGEEPAFDTAQEDEASWLGGVLLVPDEACFSLCWRGVSLRDAADRMGVSVDLMRWRINKTGAQRRVLRARRSRAKV
jgi:Zn-dependent peptidase ImmA (M78 family)